MIVLTFQPRFAALVKAGTKCQTIRPLRKRPIKSGYGLSLRKWSGKPYRSKQVLLREVSCLGVFPIYLDRNLAIIDEVQLSMEQKFKLAVDDGFPSFSDMLHWFETTHGLPFDGTLLKW